jgi:formylglycine-generating enzyme required for sulfatase activity
MNRKLLLTPAGVLVILGILCLCGVFGRRTADGPVDGMEFASIPSGRFLMGSTASESGRFSDEGPAHMVEISAFELMNTEVTEGMWGSVMGALPDGEGGTAGSLYPVCMVSWDDCLAFIDSLNALDPDYEYRLPSEAEWEYACRAGASTAFYWGEDMDGGFCWFTGNSGGATHPVGESQPNEWGLFDMSGNAWEWCADVYHDGYTDAPVSSTPWLSPAGPLRVYRGGGWDATAQFCRSAFRLGGLPGTRADRLGFRIARSPR